MVTSPKTRTYDLEARLLEFAAQVVTITEAIKSTRAGSHVSGQLLRSGTSPYANHGEAEAAESRDDFIHRLKVCHKELRETRRWLRLIQKTELHPDAAIVDATIAEADQLVRIFAASIRTARSRGTIPMGRPG